MKLRVASDIHLDFDIASFHKTRLYDPSKPKIEGPMDLLWYPPEMEDDTETTFIIPGDLWVESRFFTRLYPNGDSWLTRIARRFKYVVLVLGNHDYWGTNVLYEADKLKKGFIEAGLANVFLLERDMVVLDDVKFVGGTLWTDYNRHHPQILFDAPSMMNRDYKDIRYGRDYRKVRALDLYEIHMITKSYIFEHAKRDHPEQKVVVVTHMAPSYQSVHEAFRNPSSSRANFLYFSDLDKRIMADGQEIDYWFHGHMHHTMEYEIGKVKVSVNPRGYLTENWQFDPLYKIDL